MKYRKFQKYGFKLYFRLFLIIVILSSIGVTTKLLLEYRLGRSYANFQANEQTWKAGSLGNRNFFRTNFAIEESPTYCRYINVPQGYYDSTSNKTFIVYAGGKALEKAPPNWNKTELSAVDPYIMAFNHNTHQWEGPVRLGALQYEGGRDCHNYPVVVVDKNGYIHIFHSFHIGGKIQYFKSNSPRDILGGFSRKELDGTQSSTYVGAYVSGQNVIFVLFRDSQYFNTTSSQFYEPEVYIKSTDGGNGWSGKKTIIDPGKPSSCTNCNTSTINDNGWNTVYVNDVYQGIKKFGNENNEGLHLTFAVHYKHNEGPVGTQYYAFFNFTNEKMYSVSGTDLGSAIERNEYPGCCTLYDITYNPNNIGLHQINQAIVMEDLVGYFPTIYYTDFISGNNHLIKAKWNGSSWTKVDMFNTFQDVSSLFDGEYKSGSGTDLYLKTMWGGTPPSYVTYQYPIRVFNSNAGWNNIRLFEDFPTDSDPSSDHKYWEVRGVSSFQLIPNANPEIKATFIVPKYTASQQKYYLATDNAWNYVIPIGAHYVLGESDLKKVTSTPSCNNFSCQSWLSSMIYTCSLTEWQKTPKPDSCYTSSDYVWLNNNLDNIAKMRFINVEPSIWCSAISDSDPNWSYWEDYSDYKYWKLASGSGDKKVCVQFENSCGTRSPSCGGMITRR